MPLLCSLYKFPSWKIWKIKRKNKYLLSKRDCQDMKVFRDINNYLLLCAIKKKNPSTV